MNANIIKEFDKLIEQIKYDIDTKHNIADHYRLKQVKNALEIIKKYDRPIKDGKELKDIKGIGKGTIDRINEILKTGKLSEITITIYDEEFLKKMDELQKIFGIGEKKAYELISEYKIDSIDKLISAYYNNKIILPRKIQLGIKYYGKYEQKIKRKEIDQINKYLEVITAKIPNLEHVVCGSYRRGKKESNDIDVLIIHKDIVKKRDLRTKHNYLKDFVNLLIDDKFIIDSIDEDYQVKYMGFCKFKKYSIHRIDIKYIPYESYYTALLHFTGSGSFNQRIRQVALELGYTLNEYGLYKIKKGKKYRISISSEKDIFDKLGLEYIVPEKRD